MSNRRDSEPTLDYFELRRRHEEYKNSKNQPKEAPQPVEEAPKDDAPQVGPLRMDEPASAGDADAAAAVEDGLNGLVDELPEEEESVAESAGDVDGEEALGTDSGPGPFDSFFAVFRKLRGRVGKRRMGDPEEAGEEESPESPQEDLTGEEPRADVPERETPEADDARTWQTPELKQTDAVDVADVLEEIPARPVRPDSPTDGSEDFRTEDSIDGDEDWVDGDEEAEDAPPEKLSGFQKFMRLFVVPVDPSERRGKDRGAEPADWEDGDESEQEAPELPDEAQAPDPLWEEQQEEVRTGLEAQADEVEGGLDMSEQNNEKASLTSELAAGLETAGLSRRERRELALRQAAEKAAAEAQQAVEEAGQQVAQTVESAGQVLHADSYEDVAEGIVNIPSAQEHFDNVVDEPTREWKPVSQQQNLDAFMEQTAPDKPADDGDDEEEAPEGKPARRGLFGRRKKVEEEEDEDEGDDEDEEEEEPRARRGLFGRRSSKYEEDEDDEDDEDEYDEDDEDYDEDDDYDDYDDGDSASFGHVLLGILKGFLTALVLVLFAIVVLNLLDVFNVVSLDKLASKMPPRVVDVFLPSQNFKQRANVEANTAEELPAPPEQPETPAEQPETPAEPVGEAPVEEVPVEEPSAQEDAGQESVG